MKRWLILLPCFLLTAGAAPRGGAPVEIREWPVPWEDTRPRDPAVDGQGRVWFVGQKGDYIGRLDPASGKFDRFELEKGAAPHNLIVGPDGAIWFAGNGAAYIGRLDPKSGKIEKVPMPEAEAKDPHTLAPAPNGDLWFTVQFGSYVGKLEAKSRAVRLVKVPTPGARPYGIVVDPAGKPWFNEFGTNALGSIDPRTLKLQEHRLPDPGARGRRIALARDGGVWYVDYARGFLSRFDPRTGKVEEWQTPAGASSLPYAMAIDHRGRLWLVETGPQPNRLVGFDPESRRFFSTTEIPSGGSNVRHMIFDAQTRTLWFGTDKNTIARARVP
jgi:virginiamycin B lyase